MILTSTCDGLVQQRMNEITLDVNVEALRSDQGTLGDESKQEGCLHVIAYGVVPNPPSVVTPMSISLLICPVASYHLCIGPYRTQPSTEGCINSELSIYDANQAHDGSASADVTRGSQPCLYLSGGMAQIVLRPCCCK
jgi:hypothetical protein